MMNFEESTLQTLSFISSENLPSFKPDAPPISYSEQYENYFGSSESESRKRKLDADQPPIKRKVKFYINFSNT